MRHISQRHWGTDDKMDLPVTELTSRQTDDVDSFNYDQINAGLQTEHNLLLQEQNKLLKMQNESSIEAGMIYLV